MTPEQEIRALKREVKVLKRQLVEAETIFIEGFNGGNCLYLTKISDNLLEIKVGDCCVYTIHSIVSVEAFSGFLTKILLDANCSFTEFMYKNLRWDDKHNQLAILNCKDL